jgi:hypothetical protein
VFRRGTWKEMGIWSLYELSKIKNKFLTRKPGRGFLGASVEVRALVIRSVLKVSFLFGGFVRVPH